MSKTDVNSYLISTLYEITELRLTDYGANNIAFWLDKLDLGLSDFEDACEILSDKIEKVSMEKPQMYRYLMGILHNKSNARKFIRGKDNE